MTCQSTFSGNNKKNISLCYLLKILPRVLNAKWRKYELLSLNKIIYTAEHVIYHTELN